MKLIAHRGNIAGPLPEHENNPFYVFEALTEGYDVEVDVWYVDGQYFLGHQNPQYKIDIDRLLTKKMWCHAKNGEALFHLMQDGARCFWNDKDDYAIVNDGHVWTYTGTDFCDKSIVVKPGLLTVPTKLVVAGYCSDYVGNMKHSLELREKWERQEGE